MRLANLHVEMYMQMMLARSFDWDGGNLAHCQKHGVSIAEIEALLGNDAAVIGPDPHGGEERFRAAGQNAVGRAIFVVFTLRRIGATTSIRAISARYMHQNEASNYEQAISRLRD